MRFRLFRANAEMIADANEQADSAVLGLNFFSAMTSDEKQQYLGLNMTGHSENPMMLTSELDALTAPAEKLWTDEGKVTVVKNQGSCGSCWTFGAVGGLESRYAVAAGVLRNFAEQEYLDCVYEGVPGRDGCQGGWPSDAYTYSRAQRGRIASTSNYPYRARDTNCRAHSTANAAVAAKVMGSISVPRGEAANIKALTTGSLAVAFEVTNYFQQYTSGIIKDTTCRGQANHAVTAVGYTEMFVLVKNSWGSAWGDQGFVKFTRNYGNCGLFTYSAYPRLIPTSQADSAPADEATPYRPSKDDEMVPTSDPDCEDASEYCTPIHCTYQELIRYCRRTCNACGDETKECPSGTVRCSDGVCRHEHMC